MMKNIIVLITCIFAVSSQTAIGVTSFPASDDTAEVQVYQPPGSLSPTARRWSPYIVGIGIGILSWLSFLLSDKALGVSTAYVRSCGMVEMMIRREATQKKSYYQKFVPKIDWQWMLVLGLIIGAFVSAFTSGDFEFEWVPSLWSAHFGDNPVIRWLAAFIGGMILAIGARWAGGCTSGHGISGTLQLVVSSWIAVICFFIGGIAAAMILYKVI